jgi:hypothetical protein
LLDWRRVGDTESLLWIIKKLNGSVEDAERDIRRWAAAVSGLISRRRSAAILKRTSAKWRTLAQ